MKKLFIIILSFLLLYIINIINQKTFEENTLNVVYNIENNNTKRYVALTFDDGPSIKTIELVNLLKKYKIKATFFLLGERVNYYLDSVEYIKEMGHEIGNHSYTHPDFKNLTINEIQTEVEKTQEAIYKVTKTLPKLFRFPYGSYNETCLEYINLPIILWNVDSLDWKYLNQNIIIRNVIDNLESENIILFHDYHLLKKEALENVIKFLLDHDYEFVTVSELFKEVKLENGRIYY